MRTPATKSDYLMLFRGRDWDQGLSTEELRELMDKVMAWFDSLQQQGIVKGGQPLGRSGKTVTGRMVADGPFAESKEAVGGYLIVEAESIDEVVALARTNPTLEHGITIEVRPVLEECPCFERARQRLSVAVAA